MVSSMASRWRELSGENNWDRLLQPLDPDLRCCIIHYAQRAGAVADLLNSKTHEPDASKEEFFTKACLVKETHIRTSCYRTPWFHSLYTGTRPDSTHSKTSAREQVLEAVKELVNRYKDEETSITVTVFSLGAALATLTAMDIVANGYNKPTTGNKNKPIMVIAFTYGGPRVGNRGFARLFDTLGDQLHLLRMKNERDFVPTLPPGMFSYAEFGNKLIVNSHESKFLKWKGPFGLYAAFPDEYEDELNGIGSLDEDEDGYEPKRKRTRRGIGSFDEGEDEYEPKRKRLRGGISEYYSCHNMDLYAHGVAIKDVEKNTPAEKLDHDIGLVNKYLDRVKNEYKIPPNWWFDENRKKMVQLENGRWMVV
ncbi:Detected protein of unknown function [Hibiscus syriacus]|uniref:Phospholipase A1 n=1 Tax=Hibiscus syriacus TaxID=106335 RepID=A0A6A2XDU6_HIBSY|nr:Detected protein of unknown function [Hibiscus syriacus]